jgi:hypothetical protein
MKLNFSAPSGVIPISVILSVLISIFFVSMATKPSESRIKSIIREEVMAATDTLSSDFGSFGEYNNNSLSPKLELTSDLLKTIYKNGEMIDDFNNVKYVIGDSSTVTFPVLVFSFGNLQNSEEFKIQIINFYEHNRQYSNGNGGK